MAGGRPTVMDAATVNKLEDAFTWGCTDLEACCYANISKQTLYNYIEKHPEFLDRKETLKNHVVMKARRVVDAALDESDILTANKVIDRKDGSKVKQDVTSGGKPLNTWVVNPVTVNKE